MFFDAAIRIRLHMASINKKDKIMTQKIILTGDRPTGRLHLGHLVGSLKERLKIQNDLDSKQYVMIADAQALTDNAFNPQKIRNNVFEVALDYLSVGIDPKKSTIFIQSQVPELNDLSFYYMNMVNLGRLQRNPTIKTEIKMHKYGESVPVGFLTHPISQAADITAFNAQFVPCGEDQEPLIEQTREIVRTFNSIYGDILVEPTSILSIDCVCRRLPGIDGNEKMGKSLGNAIYLADEPSVIKHKVMSMYTDPLHVHIEDPGHLENNIPFIYLQALSNDKHFAKYLPQYNNLDEMKTHYTRGGLGDGTVKKFLLNVLLEILTPIQERRKYYEQNLDLVYEILQQGCKEARAIVSHNVQNVRRIMGLNYFEDFKILDEYKTKYTNTKG